MYWLDWEVKLLEITPPGSLMAAEEGEKDSVPLGVISIVSVLSVPIPVIGLPIVFVGCRAQYCAYCSRDLHFRLVGCSSTRHFHAPTSNTLRQVRPDHLVFLPDEGEARALGFTPVAGAAGGKDD